VLGAFLAALPDVAGPGSVLPAADTFLPLPRDPLPFPSLLLASRTDPHCDFAVAEDLAAAWGARLVDLRESGHVDVDSGHGPWPEGLMTFGKFLVQTATVQTATVQTATVPTAAVRQPAGTRRGGRRPARGPGGSDPRGGSV
jgi:hypothetical protein